MNFYHLKLCKYFLFIFFISDSLRASQLPSSIYERVMSVKEFEKEINSYEFFKTIKKTVKDQPLGKYELKMIEFSINEENKNYGGKFDTNREINNFTGATLVVGGGKKKGTYGENQGKTVLFDFSQEEQEVKDLIYRLQSDEWNEDPYTGTELNIRENKRDYINELKRKHLLYKKAFRQKNTDILERYYTLNIATDVQPDIVASIISESDMRKIPDNKFTRVEFENVPCHVFLNPKLYRILARITKPGGIVALSVTNACRRLIAPVIQHTKFGEEYGKILKEKYSILEALHPTYHRLSFEITNY